MDYDRNHFIEDPEFWRIGLASPSTPTFGLDNHATMPSWFTPDDAHCIARDDYAEDNETYLNAAGGTAQYYNYNSSCPSWSSSKVLTASPVTSILSTDGIEVLFRGGSKSISSCISPGATTSFSEPRAYTASAWPDITVNGWQESVAHDQTYERDLSISPKASSEAARPPKKNQKPKTSSRRSKKSSIPMTLPSQPSPQPLSGTGAFPDAQIPIKIEANLEEEEDYAEDGSRSPSTPPYAGCNPKRPQQKNTSQLRTASRKAKRTSSHRPAASEEERRARASHNLVEKQYRNRLNAQFERLLAVLPPPEDEDGGTDDKRLSKAEVLDIARKRIKTLEKERDTLKAEKENLSLSVGKLREAVLRNRGKEEL